MSKRNRSELCYGVVWLTILLISFRIQWWTIPLVFRSPAINNTETVADYATAFYVLSFYFKYKKTQYNTKKYINHKIQAFFKVEFLSGCPLSYSLFLCLSRSFSLFPVFHSLLCHSLLCLSLSLFLHQSLSISIMALEWEAPF